jgi:LPS export ABC transporter protein LptC
MKNKKLILTIIAGLVLLGLVFLWLFNGGVPKQETKPAEENGTENVKVLNSSLKEERDGKLVWELQIGEMEYIKKTDTNVMKDVKGKWYREDGSYLTIRSEGGSVVMAKKDVVLKGKAQAVLSTGGEVSADEIGWLHSEDKIIATGKVRIVKDDTVATADKATTDTGIENLRLEGNAEVQKGAGI